MQPIYNMAHSERHLKLEGGAAANDIARFKQWYKTEKYTMVWYHAEWCGHCVDMQDTWAKFAAEALKKHENLYIVDMMDTEMESAGMGHEAEVGFPTIKMYYRGALKKEFDGVRDHATLMQFVRDNCSQSGGLRRGQRRKPRGVPRRSRRQRGGRRPSATRRRRVARGSVRKNRSRAR